MRLDVDVRVMIYFLIFMEKVLLKQQKMEIRNMKQKFWINKYEVMTKIT